MQKPPVWRNPLLVATVERMIAFHAITGSVAASARVAPGCQRTARSRNTAIRVPSRWPMRCMIVLLVTLGVAVVLRAPATGQLGVFVRSGYRTAALEQAQQQAIEDTKTATAERTRTGTLLFTD